MHSGGSRISHRTPRHWCFWWLIRVTQVVAFDFLLKNFGRWHGPMNGTLFILWIQVQRWGYLEVVGTLKHHLIPKNLFELFCTRRWKGHKNFGRKHSGHFSRSRSCPTSHLMEIPLPNICTLGPRLFSVQYIDTMILMTEIKFPACNFWLFCNARLQRNPLNQFCSDSLVYTFTTFMNKSIYTSGCFENIQRSE